MCQTAAVLSSFYTMYLKDLIALNGGLSVPSEIDTFGNHQMAGKTISQLRALSAKLSDMPAYDDPERVVRSKREMVTVLVRGINDMMRRGYPIERISEVLREDGVDLAPPTLRSYLRETRPKASTDKTTKKRTRGKIEAES